MILPPSSNCGGMQVVWLCGTGGSGGLVYIGGLDIHGGSRGVDISAVLGHFEL